MAAVVEDSVTGLGSGGNTTLTLPGGAPSLGDVLILECGSSSNSDASSPASGQGGVTTWTQLISTVRRSSQIWYGVVDGTPAAGVTFNNQFRLAAYALLRVSGLDTASLVHGTPLAANNQNSNPTAGAFTPTGGADVFLFSGIASQVSTVGGEQNGGWVDVATNYIASCAYRIVTGASGSYQATWDTTNGFATWDAQLVAFNVAASGPTYTLSCDSGSFTITGTDATLTYHRVLSAASGSFAITGTAASLLYHRVFPVESGTFAITGTDAGLYRRYTLGAESGTFTISGTDATFRRDYVLAAASGSFTITGTAASLLYHRVLYAGSGTFVITGTDADLNYSGDAEPTYTLSCDSGTFTITGTPASLLHHRLLSAESGTFAITGTAAGLLYHRTLDAGSGAFTVTGTDAGFLYHRIFPLGSGTFTITGTPAALLYHRVLQAGSGAFALTGTDAALRYHRMLVCGSGTFVITGTDAVLLYSGAVATVFVGLIRGQPRLGADLLGAPALSGTASGAPRYQGTIQ